MTDPDEEAIERLDERLDYVRGDFDDTDTYERLARGDGRLRAGRLLPRDPAVAVRDGGQAASHDAGLTERRPGGDREAVRPRPRVGPGAERRAPRGARRGADPAHRPLPRQGAGDGHPLPALRQRDPGAGLEPPLRRLGADHDGRGLRGRGPGQLLRPGRRAARRGPEPPAPDAGAGRDGAALGAAPPTPTRSATARSTSSGRCRRPTRAATSAASTEGYREVDGVAPGLGRPRPSSRCGWRSTTGAGRACRSSSAPARRCRSRRPRSGSSSSARRGSGSAAGWSPTPTS